MRRTTLLTQAAAAAIALLAGCTTDAGTAIGAPVGASSITGPSAADPGSDPAAAAPPPGATTAGGKPTPISRPRPIGKPAATNADPGSTGTAGTGSAGTGSAGTGTGAAPTAPTAPTAYQRASFDLPQQPSGYATVSGLVPAGWTPRTTATGTGWWARIATIDRRDRTGALLVRYHHEPATGGADDASLANAIDAYRRLPGAGVTVTEPPYRGRIGLREAEWTVDVPVGSAHRTALVAGWVLNGRVVTVYVSAPRGAEPAARALYGHATDLRIVTHIGPEAG
jgi:hypothetical protein